MKGLFELEEAAPVERTNLMIVDTFNFCFRYKNRKQTDFAADLVSTIRSLAKSYKAKDVILLTDKRHSKFRRDISDSYKRRDYSNQSDEDKEFMEKFFEGFNRAFELACSQFDSIFFDNVEADDMAGFLVSRLKDSYEDIWLISSDTDWDCLLGENVHRFSFFTRTEYTLNNFYDYHGCDTPEEFVSMKVLKGDPGDTVAGIPGIGDKRAYNLIREYGSAMDIYDNIPLPGKQAFINAVNNSEELIPTNYQLMDILTFCEDAIAFPDPNNLNIAEEFAKKYVKSNL